MQALKQKKLKKNPRCHNVASLQMKTTGQVWSCPVVFLCHYNQTIKYIL